MCHITTLVHHGPAQVGEVVGNVLCFVLEEVDDWSGFAAVADADMD
jgi:hypothetical protein